MERPALNSKENRALAPFSSKEFLNSLVLGGAVKNFSIHYNNKG
jgi:hypothetical protein